MEHRTRGEMYILKPHVIDRGLDGASRTELARRVYEANVSRSRPNALLKKNSMKSSKRKGELR